MNSTVAAAPRRQSSRWQQFYALTKPRVVQLIVFCALIGMLLAQPGLPDWQLAAAGTIGIWLVAGAAAAFNCLVEQHIDRRMLRTIIDTAPVRVFWKDANLRYLGCNPAFARDAGLASVAELLGKDDFQLIWKDQAGLYRAYDQHILDSGVPKLSYDEPQTTPDGGTPYGASHVTGGDGNREFFIWLNK